MSSKVGWLFSQSEGSVKYPLCNAAFGTSGEIYDAVRKPQKLEKGYHTFQSADQAGILSLMVVATSEEFLRSKAILPSHGQSDFCSSSTILSPTGTLSLADEYRCTLTCADLFFSSTSWLQRYPPIYPRSLATFGG